MGVMAMLGRVARVAAVAAARELVTDSARQSASNPTAEDARRDADAVRADLDRIISLAQAEYVRARDRYQRLQGITIHANLADRRDP